jgi:hypothetical protein
MTARIQSCDRISSPPAGGNPYLIAVTGAKAALAAQ